MLQRTLKLWGNHPKSKSTTLQGRLILFFSLLICSILLLFTFLLLIFGITGSGQNAIQKYLDGELSYISTAIETDFGNMAATGIHLAQSLSYTGDAFFAEHNITADKLKSQSDAIEPLIDELLPMLVATAEYNACGGTFVILDASTSSEGGSESKKAGFFLKKTQPVSSVLFTATNYCLRGSASLARANEIQLLGQWSLEYDESELDFFHTVMETARENPDLPLSRLFFWSDRVCLNGNSETGFLLCVPLISSDKTCWGICGIEVSARMFKQLYCPNEDDYQGVFVTLSPRSSDVLYTEQGLIAGNSYLSGSQMTESLSFTGVEHGFPCFVDTDSKYSGVTKNVSLYSSGSPYGDDKWAVVVLMPRNLLESVVKRNSVYLFFIVSGLLMLSLTATILVSKGYLIPIKKGLSSIREKEFETGTTGFGIFEIDSLFEDLARDIREHQDELERLSLEKKSAEAHFEEAQTQIEKANAQIARLTDKKKQEIDPEEYALFLENLKQLTSTEQKIFELYLEGKTTEDILSIQNIKENTLKYHNRNIFGKLGVTSRKQLLQFATLMHM